MGRYDNLTSREREFVLELDRLFHQYEGASVWKARSNPPRLHFVSAEGQALATQEFPSQFSFYVGLERKGFIATAGNRLEDLEICLQQPCLDYAAYARYGALRKKWEDLKYEIVHEDTLKGKALTLLLGAVIGTAIGAVGMILITA